MTSKKKLKDWFLKNIILPNNEILDKPGYVISQYVGSKTPCYVRELFIPESLLASIETKAVQKYGLRAKKSLYKGGKRWGMRFAQTTNLPPKSSMSEEEFTQFLAQFLKYLESEYSKKLTFTYDSKRELLTTSYEGLLIQRLSGQGWLLLGAITGAWQHILGKQVQGTIASRSKKSCTIVTAPSAYLKDARKYAPKKDFVSKLEDEYFTLNSIQPPSFVKTTLWSLLEQEVVVYEGGFFSLAKKGLVLNEASFIYFLEESLSELPNGSELLFQIAFDFANNPSNKLNSEVLGAFGFGDIFIDAENHQAICKSYPWTSLWKKTDFPILRGFLSGILSSALSKRVFLKKVKKSISGNSLDLVFDS